MTRKQDLVRARLLEMVQHLPVGAALPPERELAARFGVSRSTLRRAIERLTAAGHLHPRQGSGTYVTRPRTQRQLGLTSFSEDMRQRGLVPGGRTVSCAIVTAGPRIGGRLRVSPQTKVWQLVRLRLADGQPMAIETAHVPENVIPDLPAVLGSDGSLYEAVASVHPDALDHALQRVLATTLLGPEAELLGLPEHSPALHVERVAYCAGDHVLGHSSTLFRADRYELTTELYRVLPGA